MSRATHGTIELEVGDKKYILKPTLAAYEKIEAQMGGVRQAMENCANMSIGSLTTIIGAASGIGSKEQKELKQAIFDEGTLNVLPKVTEYLMKLLNPSGKDIEEEQGEEEPGE